MQFEEFDKKVKEAADQHHPSYDEKAWTKMETLLEHHLPMNGGRRRTILFLLLFLLLGGGAWLIAERPWQQEGSNNLANQQSGVSVSPSSPSSIKEKASNEIEGVTNPVASSPGEESQPAAQQPSETRPSSTEKGIASGPVDQNNPGNNKNRITKKKPSREEDVVAIDVAGGKPSKTGQPSVDDGTGSITPPVASNDKTGKQPAGITEDSKANQPASDKVKDNASDSKKTEATKAPEAEKAKTNKSSQKKGNTFFVSFSAGPDYSFVSTEYPGEVKVLGGAGLGYTFNDRWTIRTGFYSTQKVYTAGKDDYKPSGGVINYPYLEKVNANCRVYEIPLSLSYNFGKSDKNVWFASTGLSSYIMKKEEYVYWYNYNGSTYPWSKTINNENKHYFSVLTLSGGYQRKINRTFTVAAEPYLKLPLAGVGYGHVKLNGAGVLFSVNMNLIKPVEKK